MSFLHVALVFWQPFSGELQDYEVREDLQAITQILNFFPEILYEIHIWTPNINITSNQEKHP